MNTRPLVTVEWLHSHLADNNVCVVDGSWHLPTENRDGHAEYLEAHIPGAVFFDIDAISTPSDLPHMMPSARVFSDAASQLGLSQSDTVVVYASAGSFSAARVWWTLKVFGFQDVRLLNGGLPAWQAVGYAVEKGDVVVAPTVVNATMQSNAVVDAAQVLKASDTGASQILDARSYSRFAGVAPEPRAGLRGGHIPGSVCVPFTELFSDGELLSNPLLEKVFEEHGVAKNKPLITSCGSGVTAAILTLALHCIGRDDCAVYDGSWTEWGGRTDLPVATSRSEQPWIGTS